MIAVAAAAKGDLTLLVLGLLISIPMVIFGSTLLMKFMERWPIIITIGGALLGWVAGEMAISDPAVKDWVDANAGWLHYVAPALGAVAVVAIGKWLASRSAEQEATGPSSTWPSRRTSTRRRRRPRRRSASSSWPTAARRRCRTWAGSSRRFRPTAHRSPWTC